MKIHNHTIAGHYLTATLRGAVRHGHDPATLLAQAGLSPQLLEQPHLRLPPTQYAELVKVVWRALDDEFLGLTTAPCPLGAFALMAEWVIHAPTLGEALQQCSRFYRLVSRGLTLGVSQEHGHALLWLQESDPRLDPDHFLPEFLLVLWSRLAGWLIRHRLPLLAAHFSYAPPPHAHEYPTLFPCPLRFNQTHTALVFDARWLAQPVVRQLAEVQALLPTLPAAFLVKPVFHGSYTQRVYELINTDLPNGLPDLDTVAQHFWLTGRTLRRKLVREGSSYQAIKDRIRREQAVQLLVQGEMSLQDIALKLGFAEASAFIRAFKMWMGVTPRQYQASRVIID